VKISQKVLGGGYFFDSHCIYLCVIREGIGYTVNLHSACAKVAHRRSRSPRTTWWSTWARPPITV